MLTSSLKPTRYKTVKLLTEPAYGVVDHPITFSHGGRVKFEGSFWNARLYDLDTRIVNTGEWVKVIGMRGITLLVVPGDLFDFYDF